MFDDITVITSAVTGDFQTIDIDNQYNSFKLLTDEGLFFDCHLSGREDVKAVAFSDIIRFYRSVRTDAKNFPHVWELEEWEAVIENGSLVELRRASNVGTDSGNLCE